MPAPKAVKLKVPKATFQDRLFEAMTDKMQLEVELQKRLQEEHDEKMRLFNSKNKDKGNFPKHTTTDHGGKPI